MLSRTLGMSVLMSIMAGCKTLLPGSDEPPKAKEPERPQVIEMTRDGRVLGLPERNNLHGFSLEPPRVKGHKVTVNGVVELPVQSIAWDWGDGTYDEQWLPAKHKYEKPGVYRVRALTVDAQGGKSLAEVRVQVE